MVLYVDGGKEEELCRRVTDGVWMVLHFRLPHPLVNVPKLLK